MARKLLVVHLGQKEISQHPLFATAHRENCPPESRSASRTRLLNTSITEETKNYRRRRKSLATDDVLPQRVQQVRQDQQRLTE